MRMLRRRAVKFTGALADVYQIVFYLSNRAMVMLKHVVFPFVVMVFSVSLHVVVDSDFFVVERYIGHEFSMAIMSKHTFARTYVDVICCRLHILKFGGLCFVSINKGRI